MKKNNRIENNADKKKREERSIFEKFSTKENIIIFSFLLIFLILVWNLIKVYNPYDVIDYRKESSESFLESSSIEYDRDIYWIINDILLNILHSSKSLQSTSSNGEGVMSDLYYKYSTEEYYEVLLDDYKIYLNKKEYLNLINKVITNYQNNYSSQAITGDEVPIKQIYKINNLNGDYYLIELNTSTKSYIGIQLFRDEYKFKIFYLE